jgi:hypothetical protein
VQADDVVRGERVKAGAEQAGGKGEEGGRVGEQS